MSYKDMFTEIWKRVVSDLINLTTSGLSSIGSPRSMLSKKVTIHWSIVVLGLILSIFILFALVTRESPSESKSTLTEANRIALSGYANGTVVESVETDMEPELLLVPVVPSPTHTPDGLAEEPTNTPVPPTATPIPPTPTSEPTKAPTSTPRPKPTQIPTAVPKDKPLTPSIVNYSAAQVATWNEAYMAMGLSGDMVLWDEEEVGDWLCKAYVSYEDDVVIWFTIPPCTNWTIQGVEDLEFFEMLGFPNYIPYCGEDTSGTFMAISFGERGADTPKNIRPCD